jgi:hypothetical protein
VFFPKKISEDELAFLDDILKELYYKNVLKIISGLDQSLFPE